MTNVELLLICCPVLWLRLRHISLCLAVASSVLVPYPWQWEQALVSKVAVVGKLANLTTKKPSDCRLLRTSIV